ncbi:hypothetical protein FACS189459_0920 [Bacilli bacterium]|nr:hypothetical protein FACS189459_0920 [Bacilli bacterium]
MLLNNYTVDGASFNSDISNQIKEVSPTATAGVDYEIKFAIDRNFDFSAPSIITYSINSIINSQLFSYSTIDLEFSVQFIPYEYTLAYNGNKHICYADDDPFSGVVYNDCGGYLDSSIGNAG